MLPHLIWGLLFATSLLVAFLEVRRGYREGYGAGWRRAARVARRAASRAVQEEERRWIEGRSSTSFGLGGARQVQEVVDVALDTWSETESP